MAKIELEMTLTQARRLCDVLGADNTPAILAPVHEALNRVIEAMDGAKAPWRKVVRNSYRGVTHFEDLECGHRYVLRGEAEHATQRRCKRCLEAT